MFLIIAVFLSFKRARQNLHCTLLSARKKYALYENISLKKYKHNKSE